jgi:hypothetical protein
MYRLWVFVFHPGAGQAEHGFAPDGGPAEDRTAGDLDDCQ